MTIAAAFWRSTRQLRLWPFTGKPTTNLRWNRYKRLPLWLPGHAGAAKVTSVGRNAA